MKPVPDWFAFGSTLVWLAVASSGGSADFDPAHAGFDAVLKAYVKNARVDYAGLKARPEGLDHYLEQVAAVSKAEFMKWNEAQQIAFLINAYNAYTLKLIVDHYPVKSIKEIGGFLKGPWDQPIVRLFGATLDLNAVEHKMLRVDYHEPRIHFALVCAARGCPPLRGESYVGERLEAQLSDQARAFLADSAKNRIAPHERAVYLSPIFKWYGSDFEKQSGSVLAALRPYWPAPPPSGYEDFRIRYTNYDWSLNEQAR